MPTETLVNTPAPTILSAAAADPAAPAKPDVSGDPTATPNAAAPADTPPAAAPNGSAQDPTKTPTKDEKPADAKDPKDAAAPAAPWTVKDLKVAEGIEIDPAIGAQLEAMGTELKLPKEAAQKLVDLQTAIVQKMSNDTVSEFEKMKAAWRAETLKGLGTSGKEQLALAAKGREAFHDPELLQVLEDSGLGNHPAVVRHFITLGKSVSEDHFTEGRNRGAAAKSHAEVLYPEAK